MFFVTPEDEYSRSVHEYHWPIVDHAADHAERTGVARQLILLRHKARRLFLVLNRRAQHGHRGSALAMATINLRWRVAIEFGT